MNEVLSFAVYKYNNRYCNEIKNLLEILLIYMTSLYEKLIKIHWIGIFEV